MAMARTNEDWLSALSQPGDEQEEALIDLRDLLLRAALYTFVTRFQDLRALNERERMALAEDCAQDALQAVLSRLSDFRNESKFTTWAYKFGINIALSRGKQAHWRNVSLEALAEDQDPLEWMQWRDERDSGDPEMPSLQGEISAVIRDVVRFELTGRQRQVLKWIAFDEVPMDVVVERLQTNRNAIYKLLHDARMKIKRQLTARGYAVEEVYDLFRMV